MSKFIGAGPLNPPLVIYTVVCVCTPALFWLVMHKSVVVFVLIQPELREALWALCGCGIV